MLFGVQLFSWKEGEETLTELDEVKDKIYIMNPREFMYLDPSGRKVKKALIDCNDIVVTTEFTLTLNNIRIIEMATDNVRNQILLMNEEFIDDNQQTIKVMNIFDLSLKKVVAEVEVTNKMIVGRLESGLFTLIDGHIYYCNSVLKLRMDLIQPEIRTCFKETEFFDFYCGIFEQESTEQVMAISPLVCNSFHRMAYIVTDNSKYSPKKVRITPFLHEKKLFLLR